jgi:glycosyltransferase involved in cell wall biosynthesis
MSENGEFRELKVLHVISVPGVGGAQSWVAGITSRLSKMGYRVSIACPDDASSVSHFNGCGEVIPTRVRYSKLTPWSDLRYFVELLSLLRERRFDVVHLSAAKAALYGRLAARAAGVPIVIFNAHGFPFHDFINPAARITLATIEKLLSRYCTDVVVCCGEAVRAYALSHNIVPGSRLVTIENGVEIPETLPERDTARRALGLPPDAAVIVTVGRLARQKAPENFLQAAALVTREVRGARFLLVGDGPLKSHLQTLAERLGIAASVQFLGFRDDVPLILRAADIFALFSRWEGLPLTILEAMAAERPVVATAVDGNVEAVQHGRTGLISPAEDIDRFAMNLTTLVRAPDRAREMGSAGRRLVEERFCVERMAHELSDLYQRLDERRQPRTAMEGIYMERSHPHGQTD